MITTRRSLLRSTVKEVEAMRVMGMRPWTTHLFGRKIILSTHIIPWIRKLVRK